MAFSFPASIQAAIARLSGLYNGGRYDASTNTGGMTGNGHRANFVPALQDVATVLGGIVGAASATQADAQSASADRAAIVAAITAGPVLSINGRSGVVVLDPLDVSPLDPMYDLIMTSQGGVPDAFYAHGSTSFLPRFGPAGYQSMAPASPRVQHDYATGQAFGVLIEPARTNYVKNSSSVANWTASGGTLSSSGSITPDGANASRFTANSNSDPTVNTLTDAVPLGFVCASVWLRVPTGSKTIRISFQDSAGNNAQAISAQLTTKWQQFVFPAVTLGGATQMRLVLGGNNTMQSGDAVEWWGAQIENGIAPTMLIPTGGSATTRPVQSLYVATTAHPINRLSGTWFAEFMVPAAVSNTNPGQVFDYGAAGNASNRHLAQVLADGAVNFTVINAGGAPVTVKSQTLPLGSRARVAMAYDQDEGALTIVANGGAPVAAATTNIINDVSQNLFIGSDVANQNHLAAPIARVSYVPRRITNAQMQRMTG